MLPQVKVHIYGTRMDRITRIMGPKVSIKSKPILYGKNTTHKPQSPIWIQGNFTNITC